ncbi:iron-containing redox enzyme family protein [Actinomadura rubrisoli]|uniref:Iron-containing redox enzyme family protein n=1 Tax=Actinomadura rubrisoli TaxID=2530368 RepID=A0A4R5C301_9ACTN|nr:hypothetical protein [Actinomadura rubrisoli]TDD91152.1 hypothetical protein E1298_12280 [Actinomadura rubrisoli]
MLQCIEITEEDEMGLLDESKKSAGAPESVDYQQHARDGQTSGNELLERYEEQIEAARTAFAEHWAVSTLTDPDVPPHLFAQWLYRYSLHGPQVTRDVERWLATAGRRCEELGLTRIGRGFVGHARGEHGHDQMMIADARALTGRIAGLSGAVLDTETILGTPLDDAGTYNAQFEDIIAGEHPYYMASASYEMERLSTTMAIDLVANARKILGDDPHAGYYFLAEHVELDVGHTAFNRRQLGEVLALYPDQLATLVEHGGRSILNYAGFMGECLRLAQNDLQTVARP